MYKLALLLACAPLVAQQASKWTAYSASYLETVIETDKSGRIVNRSESRGEEIRSADGASLVTKVIDEQRVTGQLWEACGQQVRLDYARKSASIGKMATRRHPQVPPDAPVGSLTINGVEFVGYPLHMDGGSGTVWVDFPDDILAKVEVRTNLPHGGHRVMTRQLSSLSLTPAISPGDLTIPNGFAVDSGLAAASAACSGH